MYFIVTHGFSFVTHLHGCLPLHLLHMSGLVLTIQESSDLRTALLKVTLIPALTHPCLFCNEKIVTGLLVFDFSFLCSLGHTKILLRNWHGL